MQASDVLSIISIISCAASFLVVLTLVLFSKMRNKIFMRIIAYISLSDLLGNLAYVSAYRPENHSIVCQLEGFCNSFFYPASWLWTTILVYFLYSLAATGKLPLTELALHVIGWGVPLFMALIVLSTNSYSKFSHDADDEEVCSLGPNNLSAFIWRLVLFYCFFALCVLLMLGMYFKIKLLQRKGVSAVSARTLSVATESLQLYPLAMSFCWLPEFVGFFLQFTIESDDFFDFSINLRILNGTLTALIFFWKSPTARECWYNLFKGGKGPLLQGSGDKSKSVSDDYDIEEFMIDLGRKSLLDATMMGLDERTVGEAVKL